MVALAALEALLRPASIAVVGASRDPTKPGGLIFRYLLESNARVYPVNPTASEIEGHPCFSSVEALPEPVDLAVIATPAGAVLDIVRSCAARGVKAAIVVAGGFGETGEAGRRLEEELRRVARASGLRILGPNTLGVLVPAVRLDTLFVVRERAPRPGPGPMAFISQSGATAVTRMSAAAGEGIGFHCLVGLGNRVDIDENELMSYLAAQSDVAWALACSPPPRGDRVAVLHAEPGVDAILCSVQLEPPGLDGRLLDVVIAFARASTRPVIVTSIGGKQAPRLAASSTPYGAPSKRGSTSPRPTPARPPPR